MSVSGPAAAEPAAEFRQIKPTSRKERVLITGGAGFIGSHLVHRLAAAGYGSVTVLDNLARGRISNLVPARESVQFVKGDIRDRAAVAEVMDGVDVAFHLAAQSNVIGAIQDMGYSSSTNIVGTGTVIQEAARAGVSRLVFTSSREVYGDPGELPVAETSALAPKNAYGMSKVAGEVCCALSETYSLETTILRLANVYGPRDRDRVIPLFLDRAVKGQPLTVYGGKQIVDFVHVDHVVDALMRVGFGEYVPGPVNIGSGQGTTIAELAQRIVKLTNSKSEIAWMPSRDMEVVKFVADTSRARQLLGLEHGENPLSRLPELIAWKSSQPAADYASTAA